MNYRSLARRTAVLALAALTATGIVAAVASADDDHTTMPGSTMPHAEHEAGSKMSVRIFVSKDAKMGYNLHVVTRRFRWSPWNASKRHIPGQGHAHLYVDGKKVTRLYGPWYYLGALDKGKHTIKVTLNGNDHGDYVHGERMIADQKTITVK